MDSSQKTITEYCDGSTSWEAAEKISFKCTDFTLDASNAVEMKSGAVTAANAGGNSNVESGGTMIHKGAAAKYNSGDAASPESAPSFPSHNHPPTT